MSWILAGWATGGKKHPDRASRVQVKRPDYDVNEEHGMVREATALYRRTYMDWPEETGHSGVSDSGEEKPQAAPQEPLDDALGELEPPPV